MQQPGADQEFAWKLDSHEHCPRPMKGGCFSLEGSAADMNCLPACVTIDSITGDCSTKVSACCWERHVCSWQAKYDHPMEPFRNARMSHALGQKICWWSNCIQAGGDPGCRAGPARNQQPRMEEVVTSSSSASQARWAKGQAPGSGVKS